MKRVTAHPATQTEGTAPWQQNSKELCGYISLLTGDLKPREEMICLSYTAERI